MSTKGDDKSGVGDSKAGTSNNLLRSVKSTCRPLPNVAYVLHGRCSEL